MATSAILGIYVSNFAPASHWKLSPNTEEWARFGEYLSGALAGLALLGVLITVELQRRQLNLQKNQATLDQLLRLSSDLAAGIDEFLRLPGRDSSITQQQLVARNLPNTIAGILSLVDGEVSHRTVTAMPPLDDIYKAFRNSLSGYEVKTTEKLDLLADALQEFARYGGSEPVVRLYRERYRQSVRQLRTLGVLMRQREWWET